MMISWIIFLVSSVSENSQAALLLCHDLAADPAGIIGRARQRFGELPVQAVQFQKFRVQAEKSAYLFIGNHLFSGLTIMPESGQIGTLFNVLQAWRIIYSI